MLAFLKRLFRIKRYFWISFHWSDNLSNDGFNGFLVEMEGGSIPTLKQIERFAKERIDKATTGFTDIKISNDWFIETVMPLVINEINRSDYNQLKYIPPETKKEEPCKNGLKS